jgi:hypothetical protein
MNKTIKNIANVINNVWMNGVVGPIVTTLVPGEIIEKVEKYFSYDLLGFNSGISTGVASIYEFAAGCAMVISSIPSSESNALIYGAGLLWDSSARMVKLTPYWDPDEDGDKLGAYFPGVNTIVGLYNLGEMKEGKPSATNPIEGLYSLGKKVVKATKSKFGKQNLESEVKNYKT